MAEEKYYVTISGDGTYGSAKGRHYSGGPHEIDAETAEEMHAADLPWLQVSKGDPIPRVENVLRGSFTTDDIRAAQEEASRVEALRQKDPKADVSDAVIMSKLEDVEDAEDDKDEENSDEQEPKSETPKKQQKAKSGSTNDKSKGGS